MTCSARRSTRHEIDCKVDDTLAKCASITPEKPMAVATAPPNEDHLAFSRLVAIVIWTFNVLVFDGFPFRRHDAAIQLKVPKQGGQLVSLDCKIQILRFHCGDHETNLLAGFEPHEPLRRPNLVQDSEEVAANIVNQF